MNKNYIIILFTCCLLVILSILIIAKNSKAREAQIKLDNCSALVNENIERLNIQLDYKRTVSLLNDNGFLRQTGFLYSGDKKWRYNRFTSFSVKHLSGFSYRLTLINTSKSNDDNTPDEIIHKIYPEASRQVHITKIEEIEPRIWLFSGLEFPLFACKVPR